MMKNIRKCIAFILSLALAFTMLLPGTVTKADSDYGIYKIMITDVPSGEDNRFYCSDDGYTTNSTWKDITYDQTSKTLTLNNINMPAATLEIHGSGSTSDFHIKISGENKLMQIYVYSMKTVYFEGDGSLTINESGHGYTAREALYNDIGYNKDGSPASPACFNIAAETTLTLYGKDLSPGSPAGCISYWSAVNDKTVEFNTSSLIVYGGQVTPAINWKTINNEIRNSETGEITRYDNALWVTSMKTVFSPKQGQADTPEPGNETMATVKGAQYEISTTPDGKQTAEYKEPVDKKAKNVTVPASIDLGNGKKAIVTKIGAKAFANNKNVKSVKIENGVMTIEAEAFSNCSNLTNVSIPKSTNTIGKNAFKNCKSIKSVSLKNGIWTIEMGAFDGCKKLENVTIPSTTKNIKKNAFRNTKLKKVTFKSKNTKVEKNAFKGNKNTKVFISKKLKGKAKTNFVKMLTKAGFKKKNIKAK